MSECPGVSPANVMEFVNGFYNALDHEASGVVAEMFADGGIWYRKGEALVGPAAITSALNLRDHNRHTCHVVTNFRASQAGRDEWLSQYQLLVYDNQSPDGMRLVAILRCSDQILVEGKSLKINAKRSTKILPQSPP